MTPEETTWEATILAFQSEGEHLFGQVRIPDESPFMNGHFPGHQLLPGVAQLDLVRALCEKSLEESVRIGTIRRMKFLRPVAPGTILDCEIQLDMESGTVRWSLTEDGHGVSNGELLIVVG